MIVDQTIAVGLVGFFGSLFVHLIDKKTDKIIHRQNI